MKEADLALRRTADWYFAAGCRDACRIVDLLGEQSFDFGDLQSMLEFGCGSARVLRHFRCVGDLFLAGSDANPAPIAWDSRELSGIDFRTNDLVPPLPFGAGAFDVVYALSVFTHIPVQWQRPWLEELRRVLRPGGYLLCTVLGSSYARQMLSQRDRHTLAESGAVTLDATHPRASYSTQVLGSWDVFQRRDQVENVFGSIFTIRRYTDEAVGQDVLVLQRNR